MEYEDEGTLCEMAFIVRSTSDVLATSSDGGLLADLILGKLNLWQPGVCILPKTVENLGSSYS